tara:strand:+ start:1752 stop:2192 length:441 start_codon:yes stop_codon:yes gene_type:complete
MAAIFNESQFPILELRLIRNRLDNENVKLDFIEKIKKFDLRRENYIVVLNLEYLTCWNSLNVYRIIAILDECKKTEESLMEAVVIRHFKGMSKTLLRLILYFSNKKYGFDIFIINNNVRRNVLDNLYSDILLQKIINDDRESFIRY